MIEMICVECKTISAIGFNESLNILQIKYHNQETYIYQDVDISIFTDLLYSDAKGKFEQENIFGRYERVRV